MSQVAETIAYTPPVAAVAPVTTLTDTFVPRAPQTLVEAGLSVTEVESLVLRILLQQGTMTGHKIAKQIRLPFNVVFEVLRVLKSQMLVAYKASAPMNDFEHDLTDTGLERAQRWSKRSTYCGSAPVPFKDYLVSVEKQSVRKSRPKFAQVANAFQDLSVSEAMVSQVGQAITSGRGMFLYGPPGNGKTSIAERVIRALGDTIWIPRTITVSGEIIRLFDTSSHIEVPMDGDSEALNSRIDSRWVRIRRPTVIVGGELTLEHLEMSVDKITGIIEAPVQMKSNCGALVIDDFGRQRCSTTELLNRWIIPLEKGFDFQTLPAGRQIQIPFDQLLVFATNIHPKDLVDEAFLRRIPYKVEVRNPSELEFRKLFLLTASKMKIAATPDVVDYLIEQHYRKLSRPFRYCHARDLLLQVRSLCEFYDRPAELNNNTVDVAVHNYFAGL